MTAPAFCTVDKLLRKQYLGESFLSGTPKVVTTDDDTKEDLADLIEEVTAQIIVYMNNSEYNNTAPTADVSRACALQCTYEWKRRKDIGIQNVNFRDGGVSKNESGGLLQMVKDIIDPYKRIMIATEED